MKTLFLHEPELEFGTGSHIDVKFGLMNYGALDYDSSLAPKQIKLGIVGTPQTVEGVSEWLKKIANGVDAKPSKRPNLFPRFPGFGDGMPLNARFSLDSVLHRMIAANKLDQLCRKPRSEENTKEIAQLFIDELEYLSQKTTVDVFVCAFSPNLVEYLDKAEDDSPSSDDESSERRGEANFVLHDYLKARAMRLRKPIQIIRPGTYLGEQQTRRKSGQEPKNRKRLQDEATRAWNLYVALYYKAGGTPWRLIRDWAHLSVCYVGVSFFYSLDQTKLLTSTAQVFNERGEGVILRGGVAQISKEDRQIHLSSEAAYDLLKNALQVYRQEHKNFPARVVVHKTSIHSADEIHGFQAALRDVGIEPDQADFISVTHSMTKLFRGNRYPPLRGTFLSPGGKEHILYTKGSVDFFSAYPGLYVPRPLAFRADATSETEGFLARELLALTKLNWNNTQFDGGEPITIHASKQVGAILKYVEQDYEPYYRYYM